jgi:hypothetical protein
MADRLVFGVVIVALVILLSVVRLSIRGVYGV